MNGVGLGETAIRPSRTTAGYRKEPLWVYVGWRSGSRFGVAGYRKIQLPDHRDCRDAAINFEEGSKADGYWGVYERQPAAYGD